MQNYLFIYLLFINFFIYFIYLFIYLFTYLFIYLFTYLFICYFFGGSIPGDIFLGGFFTRDIFPRTFWNKLRDVFKILSNIYDGAFLRKS